MSSHHLDLDCTNCARGVWLVKLPKYMSKSWSEAPSSAEVGRLQIFKNAGKFPTVMYYPTDTAHDGKDLPREHRFNMANIKEQTLGVFSQSVVNGGQTDSEKVYMDGQVILKFECQPVIDENYIKLKREKNKTANRYDRVSLKIDRPAVVYKPIARHKHTIEMEEKRKKEGKKSRDDKDKVLEILFAAFEKHQYYNIKDLQKITKQPITYLKEILKDVCDYNVKNPHKNMWELKPEYRHYKDEKKEAIEADNE